MEKLDQIDESIKNLSRATDLLDSFSLKVAKSAKTLEESQKNVSEEVAFLRTCNESIEKTIATSVLESSEEFAEKTAGLMKPFVNSQTEKLTQIIKRLEQEQSSFIKTLKYDNERYKKKLSRVGLSICIAFCLGSLGSGFGLWYFFPQSTTFKIELTPEQRKQMEYGALLQFALPKMSKKEQDKIWSLMGGAWKDYYEKMFGRGLK
ncbi:MAG: hypothetical protein HRU43_00425 [Simkaniaceae bacterium]|nr:hypothetical protein [Legionellales bacterium]NRA89600.1 hypothetical protein [Simkaniaceae bacterium]